MKGKERKIVKRKSRNRKIKKDRHTDKRNKEGKKERKKERRKERRK